jgi:hypothetical protein
MTKRIKPVIPVNITLRENEWETIIFCLEWGQPHQLAADLIEKQLRKAQEEDAVQEREAAPVPVDEAPGSRPQVGA